jgi:hypothetical protein
MAHSYTPGLRVAPVARIKVERRLPLLGEVLVRIGDRVNADQVVARTELPGNVHPVNCCGQLGILPADIESALSVGPGEPVAKGQTLARSTSFFGLFKSYCCSPIDGTLESASRITGQLILREPPIPVEITAYIDGQVIQVFEREGVRIETVGSIIQGIFGIGGERHGRIKMLSPAPDAVLDEADITGDLTGCVAIGGSRITLPGYLRASQAGAVAVVSGGFHNADLKALLGYEQGVAITGHEDIATTLILTEGFGQIAIARRTFDLFAKHEGRGASVSGATQIRAGVIRPEVIIPSDGGTAVIPEKASASGLEIGDQVRIIRQPHFGQLGLVTALPPELQELETGARVRVLQLQLEDGEQFILPRANVEIIEE